MEPLSPRSAEADGCLEAFRCERPGPRTRRRNWQALERRLAVGSAADRRWPLVIGVTLAIAAAVLLVIGGIARGLHAMRAPAVPAVEAVDHVAPVAPRVAVPRWSSVPEPTTPEPPGAETEPRAPPSVPVPRARKATGEPRGPAARDAEPSRDALAEQTRMLLGAREALAAGDPAEALRRLERLAKRFPAGALEPERLAYEAIARCRLDPSAAAAERFLARHPTSPHAARVRAACGMALAR